MTLQPLGDYVLLRQVQAETRTAGGLVLPDTAGQRPDEGVVVAKAADATDEVAIGDRVVFKRHAGEELERDGEKLRLVPSGDLLGKFVEADAIPA